jgi:hypothetical protein
LILAGYMIVVPFAYNLLKATTKLFNQIDWNIIDVYIPLFIQ